VHGVGPARTRVRKKQLLILRRESSRKELGGKTESTGFMASRSARGLPITEKTLTKKVKKFAASQLIDPQTAKSGKKPLGVRAFAQKLR